MAERVQALLQEQPPPPPGLNGDAPVDVAPSVANAAPAQVQVRLLSPNQCNVLRSSVVWVHDVCIRVCCPDLYSLVLCLHRFALFQYIQRVLFLHLVGCGVIAQFLSCFCLSRGANLVRLIHCLRTEFLCSEAGGTLGLAAAWVIFITFPAQGKACHS